MPKKTPVEKADQESTAPVLRDDVSYTLVTKSDRWFLKANDTGEMIEYPSEQEAREAMR